MLAAFAVALLTGCSPDSADASSASAESGSPAGSIGDQDASGSGQAQPTAPSGPADALVAVATAPEVSAFAEPDPSSDVVATFDLDPSYPQYFLGLATFAEHEAAGDGQWLEVLLPVRPNGTTGWIRTGEVTLYENRFRIEIDISDHLLTVFERGEELFTTEVAIGTGATPTPVGSFFTTELYDVPNPDGAYGPFAFALSGFSEVLETFEGGEAIIGLHGTNQPDSLGTDVSHGCVRISNDIITRMAEMLPLGTPVDISE